MNWTPSQQEAINHSGENILLSAAAGSGKTAVLVQRVINKLLDKENPVSINELLILTFTEAAASEMKKKITAAINREFAENKTNSHLKRQRILISSANISTIHSFCLEIIKANIHKTDIPINFSIISEIENSMLKEKALDAVLAKYYSRLDLLPSFKKLVLGYGSDKGDQNLRTILKGVMDFAQSMPYPAKWLNDAAADYKFDKFSGSPWQERLFDYAEKSILRIQEIYTEISRLIDNELAKDHPYHSFFTAEKEKTDSLAKAIDTRSYQKTYQAFESLSFDTLRSKRKPDPSEGLVQDTVKSFRNLAKALTLKLKEFFASDEEAVSHQIQETEPQLRTLKNIVLMTIRLHKKMKRQNSYLDFNDLEHELIALLSDKNGNPTDVALSLRKQYKEILVDEYQDTNYIQDKIFSLISRDETNIFTVGDIKQSIYKFRNAVPEIFAEKYRKYSKNNGGHLICLSKNFRSRKNIIDFTNLVFEKIMNIKTFPSPYGEDERLVYGADYLVQDIPSDYTTELNIIDGRESENPAKDEATAIAQRIGKMVSDNELMISDTKTGEIRPVKFSDIVILMRNTRSTAPIFEEAFEEVGIPLYSESGQSYLTSIEVQTVLSYLRIIDNPLQDIPLIAVLRSPMWRFSDDMLSKIRASKKSGNFYEALKAEAEKGNLSCARFVSDLNKLRIKAEYLSVSELVLTICTKYGYSEAVLGMSNGAQRQENLRLLFERAAEFDATNTKGLFSFMLYIETILSFGKDLTPAKIEGENSNTVKIMSIHKSKGLEFPVVILANAFGQFNTDDIKKTVLRHDKFGFGLKYVDIEKRIIYPSIPHKIIAGELSEELLAEEMRLLYVALTRAKEKLIISAVIKARTTSWASPYLAQDKLLDAGGLNAASLGDWICYALAKHPAAKALSDELKISYPINQAENCQVKITLSLPAPQNETYSFVTNTASANGITNNDIRERISSSYGFSSPCQIPIKMSVSEAKRRQSDTEEYAPHIFTVPTISAKDIDMISATDKGTITHFVLQHIDMNKTNSEDEVCSEIRRMVNIGIISETQGQAVDTKTIFKFFGSPIGIRLKNAKKIWREFNFYTEIDATELFPESKKGEKILLQGTMDCFFEEDNGNTVLLDYKTDKIDKEAIWERGKKYLVQLKYYKQGLEAMTEKKIGEAYICFLDCDKAVSLNELEKL